MLIIKYANRLFANVEEMDCALIDNWNLFVAEDDQVFFLGDFGLGSVQYLQSICAKLKGNKICIRGNHDANHSRMNRIGFAVVLEAAFLKIDHHDHDVELIHVPTDPPPAHFQLHGHVHDKNQKS
ncbi:hypothetical protein [Candidatus Protochlamydia sp. R18]|uniref:hypothetical protein n=1 Tax=Candidatus Protochlamydia sp. R18 TaxID=1353977 RepID=UPI001872BDDA|nr:hypothetical protein [Candidatus Protochlamydia sp. R18]